MKKYKLLIFDADETLYDFKKAEEIALSSTLEFFGQKYERDNHLVVYDKINTFIWKEFEKGLITQEKLKFVRFERFLSMIKLDINHVEFSTKYMELLSNCSFVFNEVPSILDELSKNYKMIIITNGLTNVQKGRLLNSTINKYFDRTIISESIGFSKPDSRIFEYAIEGLDIQKNEILMIGDSLTSDIQGAINFEIDSCWLNISNSKNYKDIVPTYIISKIESLLDIL
jgi:putative hydrolase of the HAD superfamily